MAESSALKEALVKGGLDLAVTADLSLADDDHLIYSHIGTESLALLASCRSDCAGAAETVKELLQCRWILPGTSDFIRRTLREVFLTEGRGEPRDFVEANTSDASLRLAISSGSLIVAPVSLAKRYVKKGELVLMRTSVVLPPMNYGAVVSVERVSSPYVDEFVDVLKSSA